MTDGHLAPHPYACRGGNHRREVISMTPANQRFLLWAPRILGPLFAAFVSLVALDVFGSRT
jgi:hypothetical protein